MHIGTRGHAWACTACTGAQAHTHTQSCTNLHASQALMHARTYAHDRLCPSVSVLSVSICVRPSIHPPARPPVPLRLHPCLRLCLVCLSARPHSPMRRRGYLRAAAVDPSDPPAPAAACRSCWKRGVICHHCKQIGNIGPQRTAQARDYDRSCAINRRRTVRQQCAQPTSPAK